MPIQILPPQLANQIAAGEVVERPASVVKELVENALDAGASQIDIDIEKGGARLIRIRDNGCGIAQQELTLALSRHATSKISSLDDLERILSLGFRGEALASISSVARLSLTSRPASQDTAWQANAEGRDMQVQLRPAAHPVGSTVEVLDLFFNTPARRKFLRSEKTEFSHIDELIKRLALSRFDVSWTLSHNGQPVRRLKAASTATQQLQRVASLCGRRFADSACWIENQHQQLKLWGWLLPPAAIERQSGCQYSYVNGRMMRDKLLNHAIRQAYGEHLSAEQQPVFVLYLELPATEVDVNVHPAKHEVRFHQARLVHDFVASALGNALAQLQPEALQGMQAAGNAASAEVEPAVGRHSASGSGYATPARSGHSVFSYKPPVKPAKAEVARQLQYLDVLQQGSQQSAVGQLQDTGKAPYVLSPQSATFSASAPAAATPWSVQNRFVLLQCDEGIQLRRVAKAMALLCQDRTRERPASKTLLVPMRLAVSPAEVMLLQQLADTLAGLGFDLLLRDQLLIVRAVPLWLQRSPLQQCLLPFFQQLQQTDLASAFDILLKAHWLQVDTLIHYQPELLGDGLEAATVAIDINPAIQALEQ
ncbi:DNA mismatch repair endonuclease MutL [Alkalimonas amylolytica]|uniref:DNA mismatch repair protein MutL n=1 Tax=Alkalimonas amylolytica TaxID=152573 RepID=A0A1H3Y5S7_ALKAM|nr:DNA mismatch repair endonuclease MutL [Alkalimonas amylolytica]SEA06194.1 DNA mismatch repair protein MutL [Alkalimonas amylolytica]